MVYYIYKGKMIRFYTYDDIALIFRVKKSTVEFWKARGKLSLYGYRPYKDNAGHRRSEAIFEEREVKRLCESIFKRGSWYMSNHDKRLRNKVVDNVVNDKVVDKVVNGNVRVVEDVDDVKVNNQSSMNLEIDSDRDNSHIEGDDIIVNHDDNIPDDSNPLNLKES